MHTSMFFHDPQRHHSLPLGNIENVLHILFAARAYTTDPRTLVNNMFLQVADLQVFFAETMTIASERVNEKVTPLALLKLGNNIKYIKNISSYCFAFFHIERVY